MPCKQPSSQGHNSFVLWRPRPHCARGWQRAECPGSDRCGPAHPREPGIRRWTHLGHGHEPDPSGGSPSFSGWAELPAPGHGAQWAASRISWGPGRSNWSPTGKQKDNLSKQADRDNTEKNNKKQWDNFCLSDLEQTITQGYSSR